MESTNKWLIAYDLQMFADGPGGEKTEKATPRKKEKAREEGQVARSTEITTAFMFIIMFSFLKILGPNMLTTLTGYIKNTFALFSTRELTISYAMGLMNNAVMTLLGIVAPFFIITLLVGVIANFIQVGWHPTSKPLTPKLNRMSPLSGIKRIFSLRSSLELLKALLKISIILIIVYTSIKNYEKLVNVFYDLPVFEAYSLIVNICFDVGIKVGAFFVIVALIDYIYQRYDLNKQLKMTKQEIKDEYKQTEGNPQIKSRIKQKMREAAMRRMMQDLPKADVVITNPTHFAVAVKYDSNASVAPLILAKGADLVAARIKEVARENEIEIVENKPLARTLYYTVDIGEEIPPDLYQAVAEVLAFVYNLKRSTADSRH